MTPGVQSARRQADGDEEERAADGTVQRLLDLRYAICPACRQRIRTRLHSVLSRCHTWCPFCRKNVPLCNGG
ncbi:formamidopyrimidine-DNA glycosylase [Edwardsiella ictaluri]|uniref:formamidopyrimidine-DNA glycosylase n=1 Tax=Edwardsiella ictaluri TaxID=67780 RepID=UPI0039F6BF52